MKTERLIKAVEKAGMKAVRSDLDSSRFYVTGPNSYSGGFFDQDGHAVCVYAIKKNETPDSQTDYFPQIFCRTIKSFLRIIQE